MTITAQPNPELDVRIADGTVRGWSGPTASHWTAIPFVQEPQTVAERFAPPRPVQPFRGVVEAIPQGANSRCTLSVTRPAGKIDPEDKLPVIVFVHGGRFQEGHGDTSWYRGDAFAQSGCILVTVNYRFRFEGFLPLEGEPLPGDFDAAAEPPYFRAVEDVIEGLRWVQRNIGAFGGDASNVTAMGQSAGGTLVTYALGSPRTKDLIHRAVVLSQGAPRQSWEQRTGTAKMMLGGPLTYEHVSSLSQERVDRAFKYFARRYYDDCAVGLSPHMPANMHPVPLLTGSLRDEFARVGFAERLDTAYRSDNPLRRKWAKAWLPRVSQKFGIPARSQDWDEWLRYCNSVEPPRPMGRAIGDASIRKFSVATMEAHSRQAPTWVYEFHGGPGNVQERGTDAQHCGDLALVFDCLNVAPLTVTRFCGDYAPQRLQPLARRFHTIVANFAHGIEPDWPQFRAETGRLTKLFDMSDCSEDVVEDSHGPVRRFLYPEGER
ncbi:carboxylesterase family protein [Corynebacterium anserum]|uniref:Carboxylesterase family protein n=1 Tax=Corynebacterium anserum TaxID=2684406 RepID=A0A7G7YMP1_9CORY|nr:carboxylesterase family protein [Corynebacterium anserum]QNH95761.1 carboxylesterase family protein [Corynebacterium anserum]